MFHIATWFKYISCLFNFNIYYYFLGKRGGKNKVPQMERRKGEKGKRAKRKGGS